jgi:hypothetical protein
MRTALKKVIKRNRKPVVKRKALKRMPELSTVKAQALSIPEAIEKVLIQGDLAPLTPQERIDYYKRVCNSLGLNPLTRPFDYILFRENDGPAKLSLYANKSCSEQLRKIHGVSVVPPFRRSKLDDIITVEVDVRDRTGRTDTASGSVPTFKFKDGKRIELTGKDLCNADMKCETKAKRRATLSICGLAFLDESELDTLEVLGGVTPDGRIYRYPELPQSAKGLDDTAAHGHEEGSERAKQAEAALLRCEAEDRKLDKKQPELTVTVIDNDNFQVTGDPEVMNAHKELLLAYGKRKGQIVVMTAEGLDSFKHIFCEQRHGVLNANRP